MGVGKQLTLKLTGPQPPTAGAYVPSLPSAPPKDRCPGGGWLRRSHGCPYASPYRSPTAAVGSTGRLGRRRCGEQINEYANRELLQHAPVTRGGGGNGEGERAIPGPWLRRRCRHRQYEPAGPAVTTRRTTASTRCGSTVPNNSRAQGTPSRGESNVDDRSQRRALGHG